MKSSLKPFRVGGLLIDPPLLLAPMAGLTHSALRQILAGFGGVGLYSTEMLSAKRLPSESPRVSPYLIRTASERPLSYQLLTSSVHELAPAIESLHRLSADAIDLNLGCPAPAVGKFGAGISLMERPEDARALVAEARKRTVLPLSAKIRLGTDLDERKLKDFCKMLEGEGIDMLSVHARLKHEPFARSPRWEWVARIKSWLAIPVVANGGIFSVGDAEDCLAITGADGLMIGRGAAIRPWLFAEIDQAMCGAPHVPAVSLLMIYHAMIDVLNEQFRREYRLARLKEFTHYFARNYQFGHHLAWQVQTSSSMQEANERADAFFAQMNETGAVHSSTR